MRTVDALRAEIAAEQAERARLMGQIDSLVASLTVANELTVYFRSKYELACVEYCRVNAARLAAIADVERLTLGVESCD